MKTLVTVILSLCALTALSVAVSAQNASDAYTTETFTVGEQPEIIIRTAGGHIDVEGHSSNEVRIEMYVSKNNRYYSASDTDLDDYEIVIAKDGNTVTASARKNNSGSRGWFGFGSSDNYSISFVVYTPETSLVEGNTSGGHVKAKNLTNDLTLSTSGGHVSAENIRGESIELRTSGGHIEILNSTGNVDARTSGGHITADNISGTLNLTTSGGHITLTDAKGSIEAHTSGGNIRASLLDVEGDVNLRTSGGSIRIAVPGNHGYDLDLRGQRVNVELNNFSGNTDRGRVTGKMDGGGYKIQARTSGGSVNVDFS